MNTNAQYGSQTFTVLEYLHGKVADFTVSENAIISVMADRGIDPCESFADVETKEKMLCYADLLRYIYLSPNMTKSYSQTNGNWSQKEGATQLSIEDKKKILAEMRRLYAKYGEQEMIPMPKPSIRMQAHGMMLNNPERRR
ncbi:MAG: hypothetical protein KBT03_11100 [Bacteroidales bacterium]|nr:hypothetical protein [Candidatus Scybalousia scybalohippi]